jgi:hypothetical protein
MKRGRVFHVPLDVAVTPANGEALVDRWWSVHPEKGLAFYYQPFGYARSEEPSPQCNAQQYTAEHLCRKLYPDHECRHVPVVFFQHAIRAMREDFKIAKAEREAAKCQPAQ